MEKVIRIEEFIAKAQKDTLDDVPSAIEAITKLAVALDAFAIELDAYSVCMRAQSNEQDQDRMLHVWATMSRGLSHTLGVVTKSEPYGEPHIEHPMQSAEQECARR